VFVASHGERRCWQPCWASLLGLLSRFSPSPRARLLPLSKGGTVDRVAARGPAWLVLVVVLTASVTEELLFRAYPIERLTRLTGARWPGALLSLATFVAFHLHGWHLGHVLGVVLPLGAVMTGLYLWRRNVLFVIITHFLLDLPIVLVALGVLPQM
jgi:CAAX protease family protein